MKGGWGRVSFGVGWWCCRRFFFRGDGGQSASGAVKGECFFFRGEGVSFGVGWWCRRFFFGGTGASQLPGL